MLSVASNTVMSALLAAGGDGGGHGLPAGQPFGFQTELAAVAENPSLSIAQWIIWLPAISADGKPEALSASHKGFACSI